MAEEVIGLLFGVEGGTSIRDGSGKRIVDEITAIVNQINADDSKVPEIKLNFDASKAKSVINDLEKDIKRLEKLGKISITNRSGNTSGKQDGKNDLEFAAKVKKEMAEALAIQQKINKTKVTIGNLQLAGGNSKQVAEYTSQLGALEDQYERLMHTFMSDTAGNAGEVPFDDIKDFSDQFDALEQAAQNTLKVSQARKEDKEAATAQKKKYDELTASVKDYYKELNSVQKIEQKSKAVEGNKDTAWITGDKDYTQRIKLLNQLQQKYGELKVVESNDHVVSIASAKELGITEKQRLDLIKQIDDAISGNTVATEKSSSSIQAAWDKNSDKARTYINKLRDIGSSDQGVIALTNELEKLAMSADPKNLDELTKKMAQLKDLAHKRGADIETFGHKLRKAFGSSLRSALVSIITIKIAQYIKEIYTNVVNLDKALVNLQIASGKTREGTRELLKEYSKLAKQLGATTSEVADAADTWLRQGYSAEEANTLIANSMMLAKLGQMESAEASTALTSAMKGYNVAVEDSISIVDKFTKVDMEAAASAGDIATAMAETATSADIAGVSMDKLIGYITVVKEVTQDSAESVGVFYKTLFARMNNVAAGNFVDEETGESLNDVETVLNELDIALRDVNGEFRDSDDVLDEVASKWGTFDNVAQHAIATAFAGTRQQEKFLTLMSHYETALEYATVATESSGTAAEKYQAVLDGIDGKLKALRSTFEGLSVAVINSDWLITGIEWLTKIVEGLSSILSVGDGLIVKIGLVIAAVYLAVAAYGKLSAAFTSAKLNIAELIKYQIALAAAEKTTVTTTQALSAALIKYSSTGILGAITVIPRFIAALARTIAVLVKTKMKVRDLSASMAAFNVNPVTLVITAAIAAGVGLVALINKKASADADASKEAREHAEAMQETADAAKDEYDTLETLIAKYEELKSKETVDADTRIEIRDLQKQISALVGDQAKSLDLVNGRLDDELKKLKGIALERAKINQSTYVANYKSASDSSDAAYASINEQSGFVKFWNKVTNFVTGGAFGSADLVLTKSEQDAIDILSKIDGISVSKSGLGDAYIDLSASGAAERLRVLNRAIEEMNGDSGFAHWDSHVYQSIVALRDEYQKFATDQKNAADRLLENTALMNGLRLESEGIAVTSAESYSHFKEELSNAISKSEELNSAIKDGMVTDADISDAVDTYMANYFADYFNKFEKQNGDFITVPLKSTLEVLEQVQDGYDGLTKALAETDEQGHLTADGLATLLQLEKDNALGGLELSDVLLQDADGYKIAEDALEKYIQALVTAYETEYMVDKAFASDKDRENALANLKTLQYVLMTLARTQEETADSSDTEREALEKQQDALNDQLDAYNELIDIRKDLLKTYEEEVSYQKELEKRQRNVSSLQTKLAVARLDTSAAGQARVRELEAELREAEEDLEDFTLEHAIDVLTKQLESQNSEYESFIKRELDNIAKKIENLDTSPDITVDTSWVQDMLTQIATLISKVSGKDVENNGGNSGGGGNDDSWKQYSDAVSAGYGDVVKNRHEFAMSSAEKATYGTYESYLKAMYDKYINAPGSGGAGGNSSTGSSGSFGNTYKPNAGAAIGIDVSGNKTNHTNSPYAKPLITDYKDRIVNILQDLAATPTIDKLSTSEDAKLQNTLRAALGSDDIETVKSAYELLRATYARLTGKEASYHTGGIVGNIPVPSASEEFAKLLKGEFVSTPVQMKRFMEETLPQIASYTASGGTNEFNAPLVEIHCDNVTSEALPKLKAIVDQAVKEVQKQLDNGMSRAGYKKTPTKRLT